MEIFLFTNIAWKLLWLLVTIMLQWRNNFTFSLGLNVLFFFLYPEKLSGRDDVTRNKIIFRPDIRQNFLKKKIEHQEFMRLLKQLGAM